MATSCCRKVTQGRLEILEFYPYDAPIAGPVRFLMTSNRHPGIAGISAGGESGNLLYHGNHPSLLAKKLAGFTKNCAVLADCRLFS